MNNAGRPLVLDWRAAVKRRALEELTPCFKVIRKFVSNALDKNAHCRRGSATRTKHMQMLHQAHAGLDTLVLPEHIQHALRDRKATDDVDARQEHRCKRTCYPSREEGAVQL